MTLEAITGKTFRETVLANPKPVLLLYHSKWNSSCSGQLEVFQSLAPTLAQEGVVAAQTNGDQEAELDAWFRIIDFPTAVLYRDGKGCWAVSAALTQRRNTGLCKPYVGQTPIAGRDARYWVATDRLGRALPTWEEVGAPKKDKYIAMFYFISFGENNPDPAKRTGPFDISKILAENPDALDNPNSPPWGPYGTTHHWGESLYGYYLSSDEYVIAKHAQMLGDAGVDVIIFDVSNFQNTDPPGAYFYRTFMRVFETFDRVRKQGRRTPQIALPVQFLVRSLCGAADLSGPVFQRPVFRFVVPLGRKALGNVRQRKGAPGGNGAAGVLYLPPPYAGLFLRSSGRRSVGLVRDLSSARFLQRQRTWKGGAGTSISGPKRRAGSGYRRRLDVGVYEPAG